MGRRPASEDGSARAPLLAISVSRALRCLEGRPHSSGRGEGGLGRLLSSHGAERTAES